MKYGERPAEKSFFLCPGTIRGSDQRSVVRGQTGGRTLRSDGDGFPDRTDSICLCEVRRFENTEVFRTDIKQLFDCVRYSEEPDKLYELVANDPAYREMEADTYDMIAQYTKTNELMQIKEYGKKEGKVDMCKAIA